MKKQLSTAQLIFINFKYLLLTTVLVMAAIALGKAAFGSLGFDTTLNVDVAHAVVPFLGAAIGSMFIHQMFTRKKN